ncbi:hypothetical protein [Pedobacter mendelii]|uniref:DUF3592 domain-containing protein n=1 Tax=Pedobacter mendelii TaxID=1908240 RepID=A0ABQ2BPI4_9SPHI|nr:hypothetical protein [Pedobacter mendelii]GGI29490.1 hypothetical protein GCM10008119_37890 [Pedobacter mendelii]
MFLFKLTAFGWLFIIVLIFTLVTSYKLASLWFGKKERWFFSGFIFLVLGCINLLFVVFAIGVAGMNYKILKGTPYTGLIIDAKAYIDGTSSKTRKTYYRPIVRIKDNKGKIIDVETDISSSSPPKIGSQLDIVYSPNQVGQNNDTKGWLFKLVGSVFVIICGLLSYKATKYAFTAKPNYSLTKYVN